jgi:hypothetical protein
MEGKITCSALSHEELDDRYGKRTVEVGKCFSFENHLYRQYENFVLHINKGEPRKGDYLVNKLHEGFFNDRFMNYEIIDSSVFDNELANALIDLREISKTTF